MARPMSATTKRQIRLKCGKAAKRFGGVVLAVGGRGTAPKVRLRCKAGHIWWSRVYAGILAGHWCGTCFNGKRLRSLAEMHALAHRRGGRCLSTTYLNRNTPLKWECALGHDWKAPPSSIISGRWCDSCSRGISERICRVWFKVAFREEFPKARPAWLRNVRGNQMELDGFNSKLGIAFEYNGIQHYRTNKIFHGHPRALRERLDDDRLKKALCKRKNIALVVIPYYVPLSKYHEFVGKQCARENKPRPRCNPDELDLINVSSPQKLRELQDIARSKGGRCLSIEYLGARRNHSWRCADGHIWPARPDNVKNRGDWCVICSRLEKRTIEGMKLFARKRGWECLSRHYRNSRTKLKWRCQEGHLFMAPWTRVNQGSGCTFCNPARRKTLKEINSFAKGHGWRCLSRTYRTQSEILKWQCKCGHIWSQTWDKIRYRKECPQCLRAGRREALTAEIER